MKVRQYARQNMKPVDNAKLRASVKTPRILSLILCLFLSMCYAHVEAQNVCRTDTSFTDILFIIDNSGSIDDDEYQQFSNIITQTISNVQQKCASSQIGVMHYGGAFGIESFVEYNFSRNNQIGRVERQFCTTRNQFGNCAEGGGDDLNSAIGDVVSMIEDGTLNRNPINKLALVIFTDAFGFDESCGFINCSVIRPFTNIDILKANYGAQVTVVGASSQAEASLLAIYASPGGTFDNVRLFDRECPSTFDGCALPRKYIPIEFDSPLMPTSDSIAVCVDCQVEIINGVSIAVTADTTICIEDNATVLLDATMEGGEAPFTYTWNQGLPGESSNTVSPVMTTIYGVTITDTNGCTASTQVTVSVENCVPDCGARPIIICPGDVVLCPGATPDTSATGVAIAQAGSVNCLDPILTFADSVITTNNCNQVIYREWQARYPDDASAAFMATCTQVISIIDSDIPAINNLPEDIVVDSDVACTAPITWTEPEATDNCGVSSISSNLINGSLFDLGVTYVVYTAIDNCGNIARDSFSVTVNQLCCIDPPIIICPQDFVGCPNGTQNPTMTGMASARASSDLCGEPIVTYTDDVQQVGDCSGQIVILRTWTATDSERPDLFSICVQQLSYLDTIAPRLLNCPPDVVLSADDPVYLWNDPRVRENCSFVVTYSVPNGSAFPEGTTEVLVTATDMCGNFDTCSFKVTVPEQVEIICPRDTIVRCEGELLPEMIPSPVVRSTCILCDENNTENCVTLTSVVDTIVELEQQTIYTILHSVTDICGTSNECYSQVTLERGASLACPDNITVQAPPHGFTNVSWDLPEFFTCCTECAPRQIPGFLYMGQLGNSFYYCSYARVTWDKAQRVALKNGGNLAAINSQEENLFLAERLIERRAYIGLTDRDIEGVYQWVNNDPFNYRKWKPGQPDNSTSHEDFVEMDPSGYWYDVDGRERREFVMEIEGCHPVVQTEGPSNGGKFRVGTTTVSYEAVDGCGDMATCSFTVTLLPNITSSINSAGSRSGHIGKMTTINPNPTSSFLFFKSNQQIAINRIMIYNINGQLEMDIEHLNKEAHSIAVDKLSKGLYLVKVIHENGEIEVSKVVVQ